MPIHPPPALVRQESTCDAADDDWVEVTPGGDRVVTNVFGGLQSNTQFNCFAASKIVGEGGDAYTCSDGWAGDTLLEVRSQPTNHSPTNHSPTTHQLVTNSSPTHRQVPSAVTVDEGSVTATGFAVLASAPDTQGKDFAGYAFQCTGHTADAPSPACDPAGEWSSPVQATDGGC